MKLSRRRIAQSILIMFAILISSLILAPHLFTDAMNRLDTAVSPSFGMFIGFLFMFTQYIYPVGLLAMSSVPPLLQVILQFIGVVCMTGLWVLVIEHVAEFINNYKTMGASHRSTYGEYTTVQTFIGLITIIFVSINVISLTYVSYFQSAASSEFSMIPVSPDFFWVNLLFTLPGHLIGIFLVLFLIGKIYKNNVALKEDQESIV